MPAFNKFQDFSEQLSLGRHATWTPTIALTNTAPVATNTVLANITQIANGNGYTTGGTAVPNPTRTESGGTTTFAGDQVVFTATGSMGPFQYAVLYNAGSTTVTNGLVGWWDYGSAVTLASGETFTVKPNNVATAGTLLTVA